MYNITVCAIPVLCTMYGNIKVVLFIILFRLFSFSILLFGFLYSFHNFYDGFVAHNFAQVNIVL